MQRYGGYRKDSGRLISKTQMKNGNGKHNKIMTALVAIKNCEDLDEMFKVDNSSWD